MDYWLKQTTDKPLFEDILWSRPQNQRSAGKLLIIGGHQGNFSQTVRLYESAMASGAGSVRVILPDSLQKTLGKHLEYVWFGPANNSGSFKKEALALWLDQAEWADSVLISSDIGKSSETAIALEGFLQKYQGQINLVGISANLLEAKAYIRRPSTLVSLSLAELQKFLISARSMHAIYSGMQLSQLAEAMHLFSGRFEVAILTAHNDNLVVAYKGKVTTQPDDLREMWQLDCAASASVFWLQNPTKTFESITSSFIN